MPTVWSYPSFEQTQAVAEQFFGQLIHDQVNDDQFINEQSGLLNLRNDSAAISVGRELRRISEEFQRSSLRQRIRQQAAQIDVQTLTSDSFKSLLIEILNDGEIIPVRVVVVILFCTDILNNVISFGPSFRPISRRLFIWILDFIRSQLCVWVHEQGGWNQIINYFMRMGFVALIATSTVLIWFTWTLC